MFLSNQEARYILNNSSPNPTAFHQSESILMRCFDRDVRSEIETGVIPHIAIELSPGITFSKVFVTCVSLSIQSQKALPLNYKKIQIAEKVGQRQGSQRCIDIDYHKFLTYTDMVSRKYITTTAISNSVLEVSEITGTKYIGCISACLYVKCFHS